MISSSRAYSPAASAGEAFREVGLDCTVHEKSPHVQLSKTTVDAANPPDCARFDSLCVLVQLRRHLMSAVCQLLPGRERCALACIPVAVARHHRQV